MRAPRLEQGLTLDGFTLAERLKRGGMADLWRVTKPGVAMPLVMKVPLILDGDDPTMIVGFEMEQMILPRLKGRHVPRFVANGDFARQPYIVMEYVEGGSLLDRAGVMPMDPLEIARVGRAIALALEDLHRQRVLHLDVKPANILLRPDGQAVLVDFGLARHLDLPDLLAEEFRVPMGTAPYIAPEQVLRDRGEPRADIFALGALLYELVTGRQPFGDPKRTAALRKRLWWDPPPPRALNPECPAWLQEIILRCLEVDPERRYPTAAQLAFALAHGDQVALTARGNRLGRDPFMVRLRRRFASAGAERPPAQRPHAETIAEVPIIMVAVDLSEDYCDIAAAVRDMAQRMIRTLPGARVACVNILKTKRIGIDDMLDAEGRSIHVNRLVELKAWAEPLKLDMDRVTFHVLEHPDPAEAILKHATTNGVDQIIMGARAHSTARRFLGSVSAQVVAEARCSVCVVRPREARAEEMEQVDEAAKGEAPRAA